ncbi:MAG: LamB/YcsF family protein [Planctomycetes bacterium]|nr:LamB/YcsF family protein [Planctomycetota bacterium]NBY03272.1 LamB/YcsF family protein [Planctomycetota bacterium]
MYIDLNCDIGEGFDNDFTLLPLVSSINIACCRHAGSPDGVLELLQEAKNYKINVGVHPGLNDPANFGRLETKLSEPQLFAECLFQVGALIALADFANVKLSHLKLHGALYHQASKSKTLADKIISIAERFNLAVLGPPDSELQHSSKGKVPFFSEGFADRQYLPDGNLVPRNQPDAFIHDPAAAALQAQKLLQTSGIKTLCIHGDQPNAADFVQKLRSQFKILGIEIRAF